MERRTRLILVLLTLHGSLLVTSTVAGSKLFALPFGLSVVEAMACGTPVVAYRRGSMPEVVDEGVTGYLAHDIESSVDAVRAAVRLDRSVVHARAVARFSADRMVDDYLRIYEAVLMSASTSPSGA